MSNRHSLAIIVGCLAIYFLANAAFAAYGLHMASEVLSSSTPEQSGELTDLRAQYGTVVAGFSIFAVAGLLAAVSGVGLARKARWSTFLWLGTSGTIVLAIFYAVIVLGASLFSHYLFVLVGIGTSWWYLVEQRRAPDEA